MNLEGSAQRRIQLGVAKKIKNGARKIVLEKAEEARIAAFSAFKSLGLNVPLFSGPPLPTAAGNPCGEGAPSSFVNVDHAEHAAIPSDKGVTVSEEILTKTLNIRVVDSEANCKFGAGESMVVTERPVTPQGEFGATVSHSKDDTVCESKDARLTHLIKLQTQGDRSMTSNEAIDPQLGEHQSNLNLSSGFKVSAFEKCPMHATNIPGGFDSFLDLWDNASEFYFDVHYSKRSEVNSGLPFEIHGMAICWGNSTVYYVNLPKDLLWSHKNVNDCLHVNASGDKNNLFPAGHWLEMVRHRWERISRIMGKMDVRKYTWNLKVQIQALKSPAVSVQKFGSKKLEVENTGFEIMDSSFLLLNPIHVKNGIDMCIVAWILWPDEERSSSPNLEKVII